MFMPSESCCSRNRTPCGSLTVGALWQRHEGRVSKTDRGFVASISYTLSASTGTPSHFAAAEHSVNSETCSGEWSVNMACNFA